MTELDLSWEFTGTHETRWSGRTTLELGPGTPDGYLLVSRSGEPWLRICLHTDGYRAFQEAICWRGALWVGYGDFAHRICLADLHSRSYQVDFYFGSFWAGEEILLVCSGTRLYAFNPPGELLWTSDELGMDGVIVHELADGVVNGEGEWDPPGGWLPFRVDENSGTSLG